MVPSHEVRAAPALLLGALLWVAAARSAAAQPEQSAAVLATTATDGVDPEVTESFDRLIRSRVGAHGGLRLQGSVALGLEDVQLALGCEGETQACLGAVAREIGVRYLFLPNLDRIGSELILSVALFDLEADEGPRRVSRRASGEDAAAALVDEIDGLLAELLGAPDPDPEPDPEPDPYPDPDPEPTPASGIDAGRAGGAGAVLGAGVIGLAIGVGFGVAALDGQAQAEAIRTDSEALANEAADRLRDAQDQALVANVMFVAGGVLAAAGAAWLIVELVSGGGSDDVAVAPAVGPGLAGLVVGGRLP